MKSYKDLSIIFIREGLEGLLSAAAEASSYTLQKTCSHLESLGTDVGPLREYLDRKGRKVQQNKEGKLFIQLPVDELSVQKGDRVFSSLRDGTIVVSKS